MVKFCSSKYRVGLIRQSQGVRHDSESCRWLYKNQSGITSKISVILESGIKLSLFLNQMCAGLQLAHIWFLNIALSANVSMCVYVCVCPPPRLLITSGMMWYDIDPICLVE